MKYSFFPACVVVMTMLAGCSNTRDPALDRPEIAVARIRMAGSHGAPAVESRGFFVSADGLIVTTRHAVIGGGAITVTPNAGTEMPAEIVQEDEAADVALVKVAGVGFPVLRLNPADVEPGLHVRAIGVNGVAMGTFNQWDDFGRAMEITAHVGPGDSGSPLLADDGSVVGVVRGPVPGEPTGQRATPAWRVLRMMPMLGRTRHP